MHNPPSASSAKCHINVCCRIRPLLERLNENNHHVLQSSTSSILDREKGTVYEFDAAFDPTVSQLEFFQATGKPLVESVLEGYNGTIFAYGQTGSGKTHTIIGQADQLDGILPQSVNLLLQRIHESPSYMEFTVKVSYLEIYQERIRDLLQPNNEALAIVQDDLHSAWPKGLTSLYVVSAHEILRLLQRGNESRSVGETKMNQHSSRSHAIFQIVLTQKDERCGKVKCSKLTFVDLAGSEKVSKSGACGKALEEAKKINKSLSCLGNVINALTDGKSTHVPYRESKLTRILQESLGGNSKTWLIINVSPSKTQYEESLSTLRFGERAKTVKTVAKVNIRPSEEELLREIEALRQEIDFLKRKNESLQAEVSSIASSPEDRHSRCFEEQEFIKQKLLQREMIVEELQEQLEVSSRACFDYKQTLEQLTLQMKQQKIKTEILECSLKEHQCTIKKLAEEKHLLLTNSTEKALINVHNFTQQIPDEKCDEYAEQLILDPRDMKLAQEFLQKTITRLRISRGEGENEGKMFLEALSPFSDSSIESVSTLTRIQRAIVFQAFEFDKIKRILLRELQCRCDRLVELESKLEQTNRHTQMDDHQKDSISLHQKIEILEKNMKNMLQRQSEMHHEKLVTAEATEELQEKVRVREEHIKALEKIVDELTERNQRERFEDRSRLRRPLVGGAGNSMDEYLLPEE